MIVQHLAVEAHQNAAYQLAIVPMAHRLRRVLEAWMCNQEEDRIVTHIVRTCEAALEAHRANNHIQNPTEKEPSPEDNETNGTETTKKKNKKKNKNKKKKGDDDSSDSKFYLGVTTIGAAIESIILPPIQTVSVDSPKQQHKQQHKQQQHQ